MDRLIQMSFKIMINLIEKNNNDFVFASRYLKSLEVMMIHLLHYLEIIFLVLLEKFFFRLNISDILYHF